MQPLPTAYKTNKTTGAQHSLGKSHVSNTSLQDNPFTENHSNTVQVSLPEVKTSHVSYVLTPNSHQQHFSWVTMMDPKSRNILAVV